MNREKVLRIFWPVAGSLAVALLLFAYFSAAWPSMAAAKTAIDTCGKAFCDFTDYYYPMGLAVFDRAAPVTGFVYSPFIAILMSLFPLVGHNASLVLWGTLQAAAILLYLLLFRRLVPGRLPIQLLFTALALSSFPLLHVLTWGQVGLFTTVAILGAMVFHGRGRLVAAAALLAFGISFKFFPVIFLVPFVLRRDLRFLLLAAAACGLFLFVVPGLLLGVSGTLRFYSALLDSYRHFDWVITNYNSQYFPHVLLRLADAVRYNAGGLLPVLRWIGYAVMAANLGLVFLTWRARLRQADLWCFHILFLSIPFVLQTSWPADLVYLPFGQAFMAWVLLEGRKASPVASTGPGRSRAASASALLLLIVSILLSNIVFFNLVGDRVLFGSAGFIFWADLLLLVSSYIILVPDAVQQIRTTRSGFPPASLAAKKANP